MPQGSIQQPSLTPRDLLHSAIATVLLILVSVGGTIWFQVPLTSTDFSDPSLLLPFLFGPLAALSALLTLRRFLRQRAYGTPVLDYAPPRQGGVFSGTLVFDRPMDVSGSFRFVLTCFDYGTRDSNGERSRKNPKAAWKSTLDLPADTGRQTGRISFTLKLPSGPGLPVKGSETYWSLAVTAPMRGVDFYARFAPIQHS